MSESYISSTVGIVLPYAVRDELERLAAREDRSVSYIGRKAITQYLERVRARDQADSDSRDQIPA